MYIRPLNDFFNKNCTPWLNKDRPGRVGEISANLPQLRRADKWLHVHTYKFYTWGQLCDQNFLPIITAIKVEILLKIAIWSVKDIRKDVLIFQVWWSSPALPTPHVFRWFYSIQRQMVKKLFSDSLCMRCLGGISRVYIKCVKILVTLFRNGL